MRRTAKRLALESSLRPTHRPRKRKEEDRAGEKGQTSSRKDS